MVDPMTKVTLLFRPAMRDDLLSKLQSAGVVHLSDRAVGNDAETTRMSRQLARLTEDRAYLRARAAAADGDSRNGDRAKAATNASKAVSDSTGITDPVAFAGRVEELRSRENELNSRVAQTEKEMGGAERWGDFDAERIQSLEMHGLRISLHSAARTAAETIEAELLKDPDRAYTELFQDFGLIYFAVVRPAEDVEPLGTAADERLPARPISEVRRDHDEAIRELENVGAELDSLVPGAALLDTPILELENRLSYRIAQTTVSVTGEGRIAVLEGWIPGELRGRTEQILSDEEVTYFFERPERSDQPPVKLRNSRYSTLFEPILKIFSLPNYRELDPTPFFAPFYTLFFGLCVADMGYGILLVAVALIALAVIRKKSVRGLLYLGIILGSSVLVSGLLLNDFFGMHIADVTGKNSALAHAVLFGDTNSAMLLAIMLGVIQVMFGYVLRAINQARGHGPAGAMKPVGVVLLLLGVAVAALHSLGPAFAIGPIPLGRAVSLIPHATQVGLVAVAVGLVLILLFNSLEKRIFLRPLIGLWELYELATGIPGDVLSYVRLFALGLSGGLLGEAIINIGIMVRGDSPWGIIPMILVLLLGTGVNLAIGLLSAFVHSLRLTFVEFYKAVGFKGGGIEYRPFQIKST